MNLSLGIVGLPNVGKSTLFNALVKNGQAAASNYPFCTIDPNVGIVEVPDQRLQELAKLVHPEKIIPAIVEFYDIAGIIKGASQGEGLGNKFLSHIRETAAILLVARFFKDPEVIHVHGELDPKADLETVLLELILADLETAKRGQDRYAKSAKSGDKNAQEALHFIQKVLTALEDQKPASTVVPQSENELNTFKDLQLLTAKPMLVVANIGESQINLRAEDIYKQYELHDLIPNSNWLIPISAKIEAELATLPEEEQQEYLAGFGLTESGLNRLIEASYRLLGLHTFFTAGPKEVRAWTIKKGWKAPQAAGTIHTDFEKGFIRAEAIAYADYLAYAGEQGAKEGGKLRLEGKDYIVQDGDVMHFRFNV